MKIIIYYLIVFLLISFLTLTSAFGEVFFYHTDNFGTPMAMTDMSGEVVWQADELPFGEEYETEENPIKNNRRFLGKELDESTGLICMGKRYLDPKTGRFTQPDPVRLVDPATGKINQEMLLNPQRQNRYVYGLNNPYKYIDPDGEFAFLAIAAIAWAATEVALSISDAISTVQTLASNASAGEKAASVGLFAAGIVGPGGGGSTALKASKNVGRTGKQARLKALVGDQKVSSADRGWIKNEMRHIKTGNRKTIRLPGNSRNSRQGGKVLAHERGKRAKDGYGYEHSNLQDTDLHKLEHKHGGY